MNKNSSKFQPGDIVEIKAPADGAGERAKRLVGIHATVWKTDSSGAYAGPDRPGGPDSWWYSDEQLHMIRRPVEAEGWFRVSEWVDCEDGPSRHLVPQCLVWAEDKKAALSAAGVSHWRGVADRVTLPNSPAPGTMIKL